MRRDGDQEVELELALREDDASWFDPLDLACDLVPDAALGELLAHPVRALAAGVRHQHRLHRRDDELAAITKPPVS